MKNNEKNSSNLNYNTNSNYRFTLDDNKDLLFIKKLLKMNMKIKNFSYNEIINFYQKDLIGLLKRTGLLIFQKLKVATSGISTIQNI